MLTFFYREKEDDVPENSLDLEHSTNIIVY